MRGGELPDSRRDGSGSGSDASDSAIPPGGWAVRREVQNPAGTEGKEASSRSRRQRFPGSRQPSWASLLLSRRRRRIDREVHMVRSSVRSSASQDHNVNPDSHLSVPWKAQPQELLPSPSRVSGRSEIMHLHLHCGVEWRGVE